mmetsp:Transcript_24753/g.70653  ORF Transcript_24753/g.70653 Transcript_24753/m.70653 type:complete len:98 (+) Transcript_24753:74-367(+)
MADGASAAAIIPASPLARPTKSVRFDLDAVTVCEVEGGADGARHRRRDDWLEKTGDDLRRLFGEKREPHVRPIDAIVSGEPMPLTAMIVTLLVFALL